MEPSEAVTLSYHAALHLRTICDAAPYEVMFLGVTRDPSRPFYVTDLYMPLQTNSGAFCNPTAQGMQEAIWFAEDNHLQPWQVLSIWIHTHPHMSANPSGTDETTFRDYFLDKHTAAMCILSKTGDTYARIQVSNSRALITKVVPFNLPSTLTREDPISKPWYDLLASQTKEDSPYRTSFPDSGTYSGKMEYDEALQRWVMEEEGPGQVQEVQVSPPTQGTAKALNLLAKDPAVTRSTNLWTSKKDSAPAHIEIQDKSLEKLAWSIAYAHRQNAPESHPAFARFRALPYIDKQIVESRIDNIRKVWEYWNSK